MFPFTQGTVQMPVAQLQLAIKTVPLLGKEEADLGPRGPQHCLCLLSP